MRKWTLAFFILMVASTSAWAADSASNRKDTLLWIGYQPVGVHVPTVAAPPLHMGISLTDNFVFGVDSGEQTYTDTVEGSDVSLTYSNQGAWARWFVGNSFYLKAGYHQRTWDATGTYTEVWTSTYSTATYTAKANIKAEAQVASFGIGNIWLFDAGFYIGADWFVAESVLSGKHSYTITSNTGIDTATAQEEFDLMGQTMNQISGLGGAAIFTLGWAF
ncbi:MAG: hypothetical protein RRB13_12305 [bacterium]|nr:hypothetical protein [bacterium]